MEMLPNDLLIFIDKKIATSITKDLLNFRATLKTHRNIAGEERVFRALSKECLWYLADHYACEGKLDFNDKLFHSGHVSYSIIAAAKMLEEESPCDLVEIERVLRKTILETGDDGAKYLFMMLRILEQQDFSMDEFFPCFKDLFDLQQFANGKRDFLETGGPRYYWLACQDRPLPQGLVVRFT